MTAIPPAPSCGSRRGPSTSNAVILTSLPIGLLEGLPEGDQAAIRSIVGQPVKLVGYSFDQAELEFIDDRGDGHSIWVEPSFLKSAV